MLESGKRFHDMGGRPAGPVFADGNREEHEFEDWERRIDAMMTVLSRTSQVRIDEIRRTIEDLGEQAWTLKYYERWLYAITQNLIARGVLGIDEVGRAMARASQPDKPPAPAMPPAAARAAPPVKEAHGRR